MRLSTDDRLVFEAACATRENEVARTLLNLFGAANADEVLEQIAAAPVTVRSELIEHVFKAIDEQRRFRPPQRR
ncbi:MAG TPA: hypothetical protein VF980_00270 [Thermoanaerobaculia bacterium]